MEDVFYSIGDNIRSIRKYKNFSRSKVATSLGISSHYIGEIERGEANPTLRIFIILAEFYEVSLAELMGEAIFIPKENTNNLRITPKQREAIDNLINIFKK